MFLPPLSDARGAYVRTPLQGPYNPAISTPTAVWADFPAAPTSASEARRFVRLTLQGWGLDGLTETGTLLVSELVANSVLHAGTSIKVVLRQTPDRRVRIEVHDGDERAPVRKHYSSLATTGRGLMLVERLSTDWGVEPGRAGKQVWFELDPDGSTESPMAAFDLDIESLEDLERLGSDDPPFGDEPGPGRGAPRALASAGLR